MQIKVCVYVCGSVCVSAQLHTCVYARMHISVLDIHYPPRYTCVCVCVCAYVCVCVIGMPGLNQALLLVPCVCLRPTCEV